jgi:hypothetical protein
VKSPPTEAFSFQIAFNIPAEKPIPAFRACNIRLSTGSDLWQGFCLAKRASIRYTPDQAAAVNCAPVLAIPDSAGFKFVAAPNE